MASPELIVDQEALAADRARAEAAWPTVSRETWNRLAVYADMLIARQRVMNLVAPSTIPQLWTRHIADSLQLLPLAPDAQRWIDLGSGAGFPAMVIATVLSDKPDISVHLVESRQKKAGFLRDVIDALSLPATVHAQRIEDFCASNCERFDVVTARALAPLDKLLAYASPLLKSGAIGLFPKGQDVEAELTTASKSWTLASDLVPSATDPDARIVFVRRASER